MWSHVSRGTFTGKGDSGHDAKNIEKLCTVDPSLNSEYKVIKNTYTLQPYL